MHGREISEQAGEQVRGRMCSRWVLLQIIDSLLPAFFLSVHCTVYVVFCTFGLSLLYFHLLVILIVGHRYF